MLAVVCPLTARTTAGRCLLAWRGCSFPGRRALHRWRGCRLVGRQSLQPVRRCRAGRQAQNNRPLAAGCSSHTCAWCSCPMPARTPADQQWLTMRLCNFLPKWLPESWRNYAFVCAKLGCRPMLSNGQLFVIQSAAGLRLENLVPNARGRLPAGRSHGSRPMAVCLAGLLLSGAAVAAQMARLSARVASVPAAGPPLRGRPPSARHSAVGGRWLLPPLR